MMLRRRMISRDKVRGTLPIILGNMTKSSSVSPSKQCSPLSESSKYCHQRHLTVNREITVGWILVCFIAGLDLTVQCLVTTVPPATTTWPDWFLL